MRTPEEEITELRATVASLESQIELIKRNLQIKSISEQELDEYKERVHHLEDENAVIKHLIAKEHVISNPLYPAYYPYTTPVPVDSSFSASKYLSCKSHLTE
jgi:hypothetical protein